MRKVPAVATVDDYLKTAPAPARAKLKQLRAIVKAAAPDADEVIRYGMPFYTLGGARIGFAAFADHIGFFPGAIVQKFEKELAGYETAKGTVRFPNDKPIPVALVKKLIKASLKHNAMAKKKSARTGQ
jgi:uncharacterized protein YdhG (YjbR/CyaY superfamily)